ncbi:MAG: hypothetical protein P9L99_16455 [Candidatus Lernaella stagnicola]|nr:hypothetical protein [Candidatus Lernaella stagnicola]
MTVFLIFFRHGDQVGDFVYGTRRNVNSDERDIELWKHEIKAAETAGNFDRVVRLRKELLAGDLPHDPAVQAFHIARIYEDRLQRPLDALHWYQKAVSLADEGGTHRIEAEAGIERLTAASHLSVHDRDSRLREIAEAIELGTLGTATKHCRDMRRIYPNDSNPLFYLGLIASRRNNHVYAAARYQEALALDANHERAAFNYAIALQKADRDLEAVAAWKAYLERFGTPESDHTKIARKAVETMSERHRAELSIGDGSDVDLTTDPSDDNL